jgi:glutamine synthetase
MVEMQSIAEVESAVTAAHVSASEREALMLELPSDTDTVEFVVGDNYGILRGKRVPAAMAGHAAQHGIGMANVIFLWTPLCEIREGAPYANPDSGFPDMHLVPIPQTLRRVPWRPRTTMVLCDAVEPDGSPVPVAPRNALARVLEKAAAMGYAVKAAVEIEFYLLDPETRSPLDRDIQCYSIARGASYEAVLAPMRNLLTEFGIPVEACNTEYGPGQFEVNIRYGDAMEAADNAVLFKNGVKEIAREHGLMASFMAKPFNEHSGSGAHIHQSLWARGENAFSAGGTLSELGRWYLGGLRRHMAELTLFGSPTPNAMKRREPYSFCPLNSTWGGDNRTVGLRVIEGDDSAVRIEQRDGSADCNPYLIIAAQVAAGLTGVEEQIDPGPRFEGDAYALEDADPLPTTVPEAIAALEGSELARATFDPLLLEAFIGSCRHEHDYVNARVSDVERARYLEAI